MWAVAGDFTCLLHFCCLVTPLNLLFFCSFLQMSIVAALTPFLRNWISPLFVDYITKSKYYSHCIIELFEPWAVIKRTADPPNATATTKTSSKASRRFSTRATRTRPAPLPTIPRKSCLLRRRLDSSGTRCARRWRRTSFWGIEWSSWRRWWPRRRAGWTIWREDSWAIWTNCREWGENRGTRHSMMETGGSHYDLFTLILTPDNRADPTSQFDCLNCLSLFPLTRTYIILIDKCSYPME